MYQFDLKLMCNLKCDFWANLFKLFIEIVLFIRESFFNIDVLFLSLVP